MAFPSRSLPSIPPLRPRLVTALCVAVVAGALSLVLGAIRARADATLHPGGDFRVPVAAARALVAGDNPYHVIRAEASADDPGAAFYYPLPAAFVALPFLTLPLSVAGALFFGLSSGLLAFLITRHGFDRLPLFFSTSFVFAAAAAQWSPLLMAAALGAGLQGLLVVKPTIGAALFVWRPSWTGMLGSLVLIAVAFAWQPGWFADWMAAFAGGGTIFHRAPIAFGVLGPVLLLAVLRWRRPEARLLLALACMPQFPFFYDQLPLWFIPQSRREALNLSWCSFAAFGAWLVFAFDWETHTVHYASAAPYVLVLLYLPCLIMILRRPNEGAVPRWVERLLRRPAATA